MTDSDQSSGLANSLTDLMTSLAVIFILLLCASLNNAFQKGQNTRQNILEKLKAELLNEAGIEVETDTNDPLAILILVPKGLLEFEFGKANIPPKGNDFLKRFIPKLSDILYSSNVRNEISSVMVEGHADPIGTDEVNLKLSQDRSMEVVRQCLNTLTEDSSKRDFFLDVLSATGRGKRDLKYVDSQKTIVDEAKSRRVVFKIRVRSFEEMRTIEKNI